MKKWLCTVLAVSMLTGILTGCGSTSGQAEADAPAVESQDTEKVADATEVTDDASDAVTDTTDAQETEAQTASEGKTLVVFFSATGSTAAVAQTIADTPGADLFEITPVEPYTGDDLNWSNEDSRVSREHDDESLRNVELTQETPDNWEDYDTVLIGYPIWWGIAAWPVNNFVKDNDFTGKTVIPFCTSASSGIGDSGNLLAEMAGTGDWQDGQRFSSAANDQDVKDWVDSLNITE